MQKSKSAHQHKEPCTELAAPTHVASQPQPTAPHSSPLPHPLSSQPHDPESAQHESQLPKLAVDLCTYLSSQLGSTSQLEL